MTQRNTEDTPYRMEIVGSEIRVEQPNELDKSFFREEYKSILRAVGKVVESTNAYFEKKKTQRYYPDIRIHNIVPIIGPRGSGKSSILHTVAGILPDNAISEDKLPNAFAVEKKLLLGKYFFVTDNIDGSLLEPYEDIFLAILAQMNQMLPKNEEFREEQYGGHRYQLRELRKKLEELYGNVRQMEESSISYRREEISDLNALNRLSDSLRLRQDFQKLLSSFLKFCLDATKPSYYYNDRVSMDGVEYKNCYLVITIDDLDLNVKHGYSMLEKLHRYLMVPGVIILMAFDQDQFKRLCEYYFYQMIPTYDSRMNAAALVVDKLSRQYMEKVMPLNLRTYLPQLALRKDVTATVRRNNEEDSNKKNKEDKAEEYLPKYLSFKLLYEKMGMRMDTDGEKRHFFERKSLRGFVNFITLLNSLANLLIDDQKGSFYEDVLHHNHRILRQEITQGMATALPDEITDTVQQISPRRLFDKIIGTGKPIPRAFHSFFVIILRESNLFSEEYMLDHLANSAEYYDFSYGEILHIIYHYGRIDDDKKELICCLIAYYSLILNRSYLCLRSSGQQTRNDEYESYRKEFLELMNGSVSGSWSNSMVSQVRIINLFYGTGLRKVSDMKRAFAINNEKIEAYFKENELADEEKIRCFLRSVLMVGMLFDHHNYKLPETFDFFSQDSEWTSYRDALSAVSPLTGSPSFQPISGNGTFSFLNFVSSAFQYPEYIEKLLEYAAKYAISNKALLHLVGNSNDHDAIYAVKKEIEKEFTEWDLDYRSFAIPLYDLDVCYNLIKRLVQDRYGKPDYIENASYLFDSYLDIYRAIARRLNSNDDAYEEKCKVTLGVNSLRPRYAEAYCNCPFIKWLGIQNDGSSNSDESGIVLHTIELTSLLIEHVFTNMTTDESISVSHRDEAKYHRTTSYDE